MPQRLNRVHPRGAPRREIAEYNPNCSREYERVLSDQCELVSDV